MPEHLMTWLAGDLTPAQRIWAALAPALAASAYFLVGLAAFSARVLWKGVPRDAETLARGATSFVGFYLRHYFFWVIRPLWAAVLRSGVPANALTALALLLALGSGVAVASGRFALGGWLFLGAGILDVLDGRVARARGTASPAGAALDSVLDRYADGAMLVGLGWYYRDGWVLLPVLAAFVGTGLVPYVRARGEALGIPIRGGGMQRLERVLFLGAGVALSPILEAVAFPDAQRPTHWLAVAGLLLVAVGSNVTAVTRLRELLSRLRPPKRPGRPSWSTLALHLFAGALATFADFVLVVALVEYGLLGPVEATVLGSVSGALVNYGFNRIVTFRSDASVAPQLARYALVSATSAALNAGGLALLLLLPEVPYTVAWWVARGAVYLTWNLPLHRAYVFGDAGHEAAPGAP